MIDLGHDWCDLIKFIFGGLTNFTLGQSWSDLIHLTLRSFAGVGQSWSDLIHFTLRDFVDVGQNWGLTIFTLDRYWNGLTSIGQN